MKKFSIACLLFFFGATTYALPATCPDPVHSTLRWGAIPPPWILNPFSDQRPQPSEYNEFMRANILVTGVIGRGVVCNYKNPLGFFSIWWETSVKRPARSENQWRDAIAGYECSDSVEECVFYVGR